MRYVTTAVAGLALAAIASATPAQAQWALELGADGAFTTENLADAELSAGFGLEGLASVRLQTHLWAYGGWDWHRFTADESFAGSDVDVEETGYALGFRFEHPFSRDMTPVAYTIRLGATVNHVEIEDADGELVVDSGHGVGFEGGLGLSFRLSEGWYLLPAVRYRILSRDFEVGNTVTDGDLSYVAAGVSFRRTF